MSVIIQNMGLVRDGTDLYLYEIRINRDYISCCTHRRQDGLAYLLRKAADAVESTERAKEKNADKDVRQGSAGTDGICVLRIASGRCAMGGKEDTE